MIPVSSLHYGVLQQANHTDSEYLNELSSPQRDYYINRGKDIVVEWLVTFDEEDSRTRRYLQEIVFRDVKLQTKNAGNKVIAAFPVNFYKQKSLYGLARRTGCAGERRIKIYRPTSEKYQAAILNSNTNRVWDFEQTFAQEAHDGLHVFREEEVTLDIYLDYIRKVEDVAYASGADGGQYLRHDGKLITEDKDLDLEDPFFFSKIVNMAVLEIKKDYTDLADYGSQRDFILSIDRT